jgi:copper(I)-binding protein
MKRKYYLFPLMAMTALSLTLAACDDKVENETAATTETTTEAPMAPEAAAPTAAIQAEGATAYATAPDATTGAVFLTIHNATATADKLVGASTPAATTVEIHQSATDANGVATMTKVDGVAIPAGQQVTLDSNGYHIMLMGLTAPLTEGTPFDITLDFETAADVTLPVTVVAPAGATMPMDHSAHDSTAPAADATAAPTADEAPVPAEGVTAPANDPMPAPAPEATTPAPTPAPEAPAAGEAPAAQ